ncbi:EME1 [Acrasis kona]|uniref:EME1 n=1 Tax=Acrasis kona TaxID=1008807 RepID=A0AAW2YUH7_9EUKA
MEVINLDSDEDDIVEVSSFVTKKTVVTPNRNSSESTIIPTIQRRDSTLLNTSIDLDSDIYDLILGTKESDLRKKHCKDVVEDSMEVSAPESPKPKKRKPEVTKEVVTATKKRKQNTSSSQQDSQPTLSQQSTQSDDEGYDSCSSTSSTQSAKEYKKVTKDFVRRAKGSYALDELNIQIDSNMIKSVGGKSIKEQLELHFDKSRILVQDLDVAHSIKWTRYLPLDYVNWLQECANKKLKSHRPQDGVVKVEINNYCLVRIPGDTMVELIQANTLVEYVQCLKQHLCEQSDLTNNLEMYQDLSKPLTIILLMEGLHSFIKGIEQAKYKRIMEGKKKTKDSVPDIALPNIEKALLEMQLIHGVRVFETVNAAATAQFIAQMTKNLAEAPYKKRTSVLDFKSSSATPFSLSTAGGGRKKQSLQEVWRKQLTEVPSVSEKIANAVADKYPSVRTLLRAYEEYEGDSENMLKDLQVDQKRKVGPVASKCISEIFGADE